MNKSDLNILNYFSFIHNGKRRIIRIVYKYTLYKFEGKYKNNYVTVDLQDDESFYALVYNPNVIFGTACDGYMKARTMEDAIIEALQGSQLI